MTWLILTSLLAIGVILVVTEILFVPGTTLVGIIGLFVTIGGIYYAFISFESQTAWIIVGLTVLLNFAVLFYGFRSGVWKKFALKESITSRAFDGRLLGLEIGMEGKAVSDLKPIGKAEFIERIFEVKSNSGLIPVGSKVIITKLENNTIIVNN
ncbi:NfeD family protein [Aquiflexum sp.]|uniref:NfeD family protein n=1 Tax=Aquiflexum sp. TaxID=1872584 RepID=UPI0035944AE2